MIWACFVGMIQFDLILLKDRIATGCLFCPTRHQLLCDCDLCKQSQSYKTDNIFSKKFILNRHVANKLDECGDPNSLLVQNIFLQN